jgi:alkyldihydroxyacetonephosphate synthase
MTDLAELRAIVGASHVITDDATRLRALSQWSPVLIKRRQAAEAAGTAFAGIPGAVVRPGSTEETASVVRWANRTKTLLYPVGGSSSLTDSTDPAREAGVAVDLARLDTVAWDEESLLVTVGAGTVLAALEEQLERHRYTLGHLPASIGLLTVGGAVAVNAIGLLSGKYGRQADLTAGLEAVLPTGEIIQTSAAPGGNAAFDLHSLLIGSEGQFGLITGATLRMCSVPEARAYAVFTFPTLTEAMDAARLIYRSDSRPAAVRVFDGDAAAPFLPNVSALLIAAFEGEELTQTGPYQLAHAVCQTVGGTAQPPEIGDAWFDARTTTDWLTANARPGGLADRFAVSSPWSAVKTVEAAMRQAIVPLVTHLNVQIAHCTPHGAAIEVGWQAQAEPATPTEALALYERIVNAGLTACLDAGGTVAHHFGIGRTRQRYFARERGPAAMAALQAIKAALDPNHILPCF